LFFITVHFGLDVIGIAYGQNLQWWSWHVTLATIAILSGYKFFFQNWAKGNQEKWAVIVGYVIAVCLSGYIPYYFGFNALTELRGSLEIVSIFLLFNFLLFFFCFGLGKEKEMKKKLSYWLIWVWILFLILVSGDIVYLQATHQVTRQERLAARALNIVRWQKEDVNRSIALYGLEAATQKAKEAYQAGDSDSLSQLEKEITEIEKGVREIPRAKYLAPENLDKDIKKIKSLPGDVLGKLRSSSSESKQWKSVLKKDFTGNGTEDNSAVFVANFGSDIQLGDKIIMISPLGKDFFVTDAGNWVKCPGRYEIVSQCTGNGAFYFYTEKDAKVTLEIQRLIKPPKRNDLVTLADFSAK
jgi:hypothetical protein